MQVILAEILGSKYEDSGFRRLALRFRVSWDGTIWGSGFRVGVR